MPGSAAEAGRLRAGLELTGLQLDSTGSGRAARLLRDALERRDDIELVPFSMSQRRGRLAAGLERELWWFPLALPRRARELELDVLHCPFPLAPWRAGMPLVVTLHDVLPWEHPEWFGRLLGAQQRLVAGPAARRAARVIAPSRHTAERIEAILGIGRERIDVVMPAADPMFTPADGAFRRDGEAPYLLAVGTLQPRKNLDTVLTAFERLVAEGGEHRLVVAGARGWGDAALTGRLRGSPAAGRIDVAGRVSDEELVDLYRGADCLAFLSLGEGFGFPVLEAMACGTPVVCSSTTSLPEVAGGAAELADPSDVADVERALDAVLGSPERREELRRAGLARAAEFTWDRAAAETVASYRRAVAA